MNYRKEKSPGGRGQGFLRAQTTRGGLQKDFDTSSANRLLARLDRVRQTDADQWIACCPAHADRNPSLSIKQSDYRLLVHCFAGCEVGDVMTAVDLNMADLFDRPPEHHRTPLKPDQRRRYGQALDALRVLDHECLVVMFAADDMAAGFNLDPDHRQRLRQSVERIRKIREMLA